MRNWNLYFSLYIFYVFNFLHYLWGIETLKFTINNGVLMIFLHYLWGIETPLKKYDYYPRFLTFYITYEELKQNKNFLYPSAIFPFLHYLWGIETVEHCSKAVSSSSFYITYEELKPVSRFPNPSPAPLFTLPMRNWNCQSSWYSICSGIVFLHYLWGIETSSSCPPPWVTAIFLHYLRFLGNKFREFNESRNIKM